MGTVWGHVGPGQAELTVEEAGLGSGVAFGVAIPSPAQLLAVEEVPEPGAGVQTVPAGRTSALSPAPAHAQPRPLRAGPSARRCGSPLPWPHPSQRISPVTYCAPTVCPAQSVLGPRS